MLERCWRQQDSHKDGWLVVGRVGGPGTFWEGYEYTLGIYPFRWLAYCRAWCHVQANPWRMAKLERITGNRPYGWRSACHDGASGRYAVGRLNAPPGLCKNGN